ncbi:hypothetical protein IX317_000651 [Fusobacterium sp. DD29]|uniref:baseplate assembly protein n=1 Tax=unclassified Fusobacterium TaxID=2648384 RepID=UPI001B8D5815|nr:MULTISPECIES: baseplate J/gp47 family protein [unclassified Fusobacterium]MBR8700227.1 hypothetical protein [Fusobacterium sp. DD45]MBR8710518.1 hypothetical protein [Fusobacterium sp. DD28]MBR8748990.1 hypothetical protein [Fusobacterium sp. DD29]MBR8751032.1 hypothetical protein [Fusobacterium sp. DD26]MBR8761296.1 hypothetical protein [Fusobacterium sp. DD25]
MKIGDDYQAIEVDAIKNRQIAIDYYEKKTGLKLTEASPEFLIFSSVAYALALREEEYNDKIKQNYLRFARDERLDLQAEVYGERGDRVMPHHASATFEFSILSEKQKEIIIPKGSLIKYNNLYFSTIEEYRVPIGATSVEGIAKCTTPGADANGIEPGAITTMVDLYLYYKDVKNTTATNGGTDMESDDSYRERIRMVPDSFSVAGPDGAYKFWTFTVSPEITDVEVGSNKPCEVDIYPLTAKGKPSQELKKEIEKVVNGRYIRPLTDKVNVLDPEEVQYNIKLDYYIASESGFNAGQIKKKAQDIIDKYVLEQRKKLGLDIVPDDIIHALKSVGVKRVVISEPAFKKIAKNQYTVAKSINLNYAGVEDL